MNPTTDFGRQTWAGATVSPQVADLTTPLICILDFHFSTYLYCQQTYKYKRQKAEPQYTDSPGCIWHCFLWRQHRGSTVNTNINKKYLYHCTCFTFNFVFHCIVSLPMAHLLVHPKAAAFNTNICTFDFYLFSICD